METPDNEKDIGTWTKHNGRVVRRSPRKAVLSEEEKKKSSQVCITCFIEFADIEIIFYNK